MKKLCMLALPAVMSVVLLSGCGHDDSKYDPSEVSAEVRSAFAEHQGRTAESVERTGEGFEELQARIENLLTPDQADIFHSTDFDTVQERFETLNPKTTEFIEPDINFAAMLILTHIEVCPDSSDHHICI